MFSRQPNQYKDDRKSVPLKSTYTALNWVYPLAWHALIQYLRVRAGSGATVVLWSSPAVLNCTGAATCNSTLMFRATAGQYMLTVSTALTPASGPIQTLSSDIWTGTQAPGYLVLLNDGNLIVMQPSTVVWRWAAHG
jgi:hypothetical protein